MTFTLAITVYNRYELLLESFAEVIHDPRIDEVLIMDDCSAPEYWNKIKELPKYNDKIKVVRQLQNRGMSVNKKDAVANSRNEWVILFDSDNVIGPDYLDAFEAHAKTYPDNQPCFDVIYCPAFAKPQFDYSRYEGQGYHKESAKTMISESSFNMLLNTCNYIVNKDWYLEVWKENKEMKGSDTIWFNYLWLAAGNFFHVVRDMHYYHRVHSGSGFMEEVNYNMQKAAEIKKLIEAL